MISDDYWGRRFESDPKVVGAQLPGWRMYEVVGVAEKGFIGTEPGTRPDCFCLQ